MTAATPLRCNKNVKSVTNLIEEKYERVYFHETFAVFLNFCSVIKTVYCVTFSVVTHLKTFQNLCWKIYLLHKLKLNFIFYLLCVNVPVCRHVVITRVVIRRE